MTGILKAEDVKNTIEKIFANKPKVIPMNKVAFDLGYNFVK